MRGMNSWYFSWSICAVCRCGSDPALVVSSRSGRSRLCCCIWLLHAGRLPALSWRSYECLRHGELMFMLRSDNQVLGLFHSYVSILITSTKYKHHKATCYASETHPRPA